MGDTASDGHRRRRLGRWSALMAFLFLGGIAAFSLVEWGFDALFEEEGASGAAPLSQSPDFTLADAAQFEDFNLYWLGEEFDGLPMRSLKLIHDPGLRGHENLTKNDIVIITYGTCEVPAGATTCRIPLSLNIQPYCAGPPEYLSDVVKTGPAKEMRGALVQWRGVQATIWTNDASIDVNGADAAQTEAAIKNLVGLTPGGPKSPSEDLGPPSVSTASCGDLPFATGNPVQSPESPSP